MIAAHDPVMTDHHVDVFACRHTEHLQRRQDRLEIRAFDPVLIATAASRNPCRR